MAELKEKPKSVFAPAGRSSIEQIKCYRERMLKEKVLLKALNSIPDLVFVLDSNRQVIFANHAVFETFDLDSDAECYGKRPGEFLHCVNCDRYEDGCGASEFCRECGAVNAILNSQAGEHDIRECSIVTKEGAEGLVLRVWATPFEEMGKKFVVFAVQNISNEKRRNVLERIFFHDILNLAGGIHGVSEILPDLDPENLADAISAIRSSTEALIDEIYSQKELNAAESNELKLVLAVIPSMYMLENIKEIFEKHTCAIDRNIKISHEAIDFEFVSDITILRRILGNMLKNALEAVASGEDITLSCKKLDNGDIEFSVRNPGYMPEKVQFKLFQRAFSTKGTGRGLGTYAVKLLTEKYLRGEAGFRTSERQGTIFYVRLPRTLPPDDMDFS